MLKNTYEAASFAVVVTMIAALVPAGVTFANDANVTLTTTILQAEPITLYSTDSSPIATLDPQRADDPVSIAVIENLFLGLTNYDPLVPGTVTAELATEWSVSDDGLVWTFTLRDDVPWVRWDRVAHAGEVVRMVTAADVEYGIKRACDPRLAAYYSNMARQIVEGCDVLFDTPIEDITPESYDAVNVVALDDTLVQVTLQFEAGYFFSQTPMWIYRPVPRDVIEEYGDDWTEPGNIVTNGPFVIDELARGVRRVFVRNPFYPADMVGPGNIERHVQTIVQDPGTEFALYRDNQIDISGIPMAELQTILQDPSYADQLNRVADLTAFYFGFAVNKAPFDNVNARRAFSAAVDRNAFIREVRQNRGVAMIHFTPPGMFGAPPINEVGVGYDPEFARAQLAEAGYPGCLGFPDIEVVTYTGAGPWGEFLVAAAERELGCDPNIMTVEQQEPSVMLETVDKNNSPEDRPNLWALVWGPDYADANNWVNDVLYCEGQNDFTRPCSEVDGLIIEAAQENNPDRRIELYYRIEDMFFGSEGVFPIIPLFLRLDYVLTKPWYDAPSETDGLFGGPHWDWRSIDQEVQLAARQA